MAAFGNADPATGAVAVTPNNSTVVGARALYIGTTGDVAIKSSSNASAVTFKAVPAGAILPVRAHIVMATGTTASDIVALS